MKRKKHFLTIIFLILFAEVGLSQIKFQKTDGETNIDFGYSVQQTTDGGYIITGGTNSFFGAGSSDVYLIKTDTKGDTLWTKTFGGTNNDLSYSVQQTTDGGYIITGGITAFGMSNADIYLIKTDSNGDTLWTKAFGGTNQDVGYSVQQTTDGGYIIAGFTESFGAGSSDVYLIKTDANGDSIWTKTFGGATLDYGYSVQQITDGGYIIAGTTASFGAGSNDVYLIKTDTIGDTLWTRTFGGANQDVSYSVQQTTDSGYIIAGFTESFGAGSYDGYLIKTNTNGDTLWTKTFGGATYDIAHSVRQTTDGGYIITGETFSFGAGNADVYLIKTDANGDSLWIKTFGGTDNDKSYSIQQTTDGGYIIAGQTLSFGAGNYDVYLIKADANGNSGCNQGSSATIITTPATQVTSPATIVTSPSTIETNPVTLVGSGGIVNTLCTTVNVNEIVLDNSFTISPNPSASTFVISFEGIIMKANVKIYNILGEKVFTENILYESKKEINVKNISQGIYFVKVFDGEKYYSKKLILVHD